MNQIAHGLQPYPDYRDSGVPWLGEIPGHWHVQPGFSTFRQKQQKNAGLVETTVLSLSYGRIVVKPVEKLHGLVPASFETYQIVNPGDIIVRPTDLQNDWTSLRVGIVRDRGIITSAYLCLQPLAALSPEYLFHLLHSYDLLKVFYGMGSGLRQNLDFSDLKRMPVAVPPPTEQAAIVRFLEHIDRRVNRFVHAKRRLVALLNEQKQAIIHRAVTRGLDPDVPLKPSGVAWLGDVPEHWEVKKLKWLAKFNPSKSELREKVQPDSKVTFLPMEKVGTNGQVDYSELRYAREVWQGFTYFQRGDVVIAKITPCFENGKGAYLGQLPTEYGFGTTEFIVLRANSAILPEFLYILSTLRKLRILGANAMTGAAGQQRVPTDFLQHFVVPVPPINEQRAILHSLSIETKELDQIIARTQREIDLIREYRTRLVANVVTGKLDVRGVALADDMPIDDDMPLDGDDLTDDADLETTGENTDAND